MNHKDLKYLKESFRLKEDRNNKIYYGWLECYPLFVDMKENQPLFVIYTKNKNNDLRKKFKEKLEKSGKVDHVLDQSYCFILTFLDSIKVDDIKSTLLEINDFLKQNHFLGTCKYCWHDQSLDFYLVHDHLEVLCENCFKRLKQENERLMVRENYGKGLLGAFIGAFIGVILWIAIYRAGWIIMVVAWCMMWFAIQGYHIFAGDMSQKGMISSILICCFLIFVAEYLSLGFDTYLKMYDQGVSLIYCIQLVPQMLTQVELQKQAIRDLFLSFSFILLVGNHYILDLHKELKGKHKKIERMK